MKRFVIFITLILTNIGCSYNTRYLPGTYKFTNQKEFDKSYDQVWRATSDLIATWGVAPNNISKESGLIVFSFTLGDDYTSYCDCGTTGNGFGWYHKFKYPIAKTTISVTTISANKTKVKINTFFSSELLTYKFDWDANIYKLYYSDGFNCNSKGLMEKQILNYIEVFN